MVSINEKDTPVSAEIESPYLDAGHEPMNRTATVEPYAMSWRTLAGFIALSISLSSTSFAITGPNSSIGYIAADYPDQAHKASWIANTPIICLIALTGTFGATSDRYGKKQFLLGGGTIAIIGSVVSAYATSINMVIGGSVLAGIGGAALNQAIPAGMEIIPAKYRTAEAALMAAINGSLGIVAGIAVFSSCVQYGLGWRWGYKIQAMLYGVAVIATALFYHPPPTRFREGQTFMKILKNVDFIGTALLATGAVLVTLPLTWGGTQYAWGSAHVVPFLVIGPVVLIVFGIYEWKGRTDGILHHDFFESRTFPIFVFYGFIDGIILYGTSVFIPDQSRSVYYTKPLPVARGLIIFSTTLLAGFVLAGYVTTKMKQFRLPLIFASGALALFSGLVVRANESNAAYFEGMVGLAGFWVGGTEIIPIGAIGLVVPSYLIGTSSMVFVTCRSLGGVMGITIFTAIYSNKAAVSIPNNVVPLLAKAGIPANEYATIIDTVINAPGALANIPGLSASTIAEIIVASQKGASESYRYIWYCIMAVALALFILAFFVKDAPHKMNNQVESALERNLSKTPAVGDTEVEV